MTLNFLRLTFILALFSTTSLGQTCVNIGFEDSSFVNWEGLNGIYRDTTFNSIDDPVYDLMPGFDIDGHVITSGFEYDPYSDSTILTVAPGSTHSVRLGDDNVGRRTEWLRYELNAQADEILVYAVAVILEDPNHDPIEQPGLFVRLLDSVGNELDTICGNVTYVPGTNLSGFQTWSQNSNIFYRPWDFAGVDLAPYAGQDITLEFHTRDCELGGHFGYAYVDASCEPRAIQVDYCLGQSDSITFTAPLGFSYLWSNGDTNRSFTILADSSDTLYTCELTSTLTGCSFELEARPEPTFYTNFDVLENSCGEAQLKTTIEINRGNIVNYFWDFGDSTTNADTSILSQPTYTYPGPGRYPVKLIVDDGLGCSSDTLIDTANIYFPPFADFSADTVCLLDSTTFTNQSNVSPNVGSFYVWDFGDGNNDTAQNPIHLYGSDSLKTVTLIVWSDSLQCGDTISKVIEVFPRPTVAFTHLEPDSCIPHQVNFLNLSTADSVYPIDNYVWSFGNEDSSIATAPTYVYQDPGLFTVYLKATDVNGCNDSSIVLDYILVAPIPEADFTVSDTAVHINNAEVIFENQSNSADTYQWLFGSVGNSGAGTSTDRDPVWEFKSSGDYRVKLTAISDFGCFDTAFLNVNVIDDRTFLPNVITPNGDGVNDAFEMQVDLTSVTKFQCTIFNRWGSEVFRSTTPGFSWEGRVNGESLPSGVYYYEIEYLGFEDKEFGLRGSVQLLR